VVEIAGSDAVVDLDGRRRRASLLLGPQVALGDWVIVAAGTVLERIEEEEAMELQALVRVATRPPASSQGGRHGHAT
jgi:hydrogenase expression/formation protein HypC